MRVRVKVRVRVRVRVKVRFSFKVRARIKVRVGLGLGLGRGLPPVLQRVEGLGGGEALDGVAADGVELAFRSLCCYVQ